MKDATVVVAMRAPVDVKDEYDWLAALLGLQQAGTVRPPLDALQVPVGRVVLSGSGVVTVVGAGHERQGT